MGFSRDMLHPGKVNPLLLQNLVFIHGVEGKRPMVGLGRAEIASVGCYTHSTQAAQLQKPPASFRRD